MNLQEEVIGIIGETSEKDEGGNFGFGVNIGGIELYVSTNDQEVQDIGETHFQHFLGDSVHGAKMFPDEINSSLVIPQEYLGKYRIK